MTKIDRTVKLDHAYTWKRGNYLSLVVDEETYRMLDRELNLKYKDMESSEARVWLTIFHPTPPSPSTGEGKRGVSEQETTLPCRPSTA